MSMTLLVAAPAPADAHESCAVPQPSAAGLLAEALAIANVFSSFLHTDSMECVSKTGDVEAVMDRDWGNGNSPDTFAPCIDGMAADYFPCDGVDLMSHVSMTELGLGQGDVRAEVNDIWGWTDTGARGQDRDYALVGSVEGTVFVDITDNKRPLVLGLLPTQSDLGADIWRDIKVYEDHAFIVSEHANHGVQVFDLTKLRGLEADSTRRFEQDAVYLGMGSAHNIAINEDTGFAYALGSGQFSSQGLPYSVAYGELLLLASGAQFGPLPTQDGTTATFVDTGSTACGTDIGDLTGAIALIDRGACAFVTKAETAAAAGAVGVIVINNQPTGYVTMAGSSDVDIPSVFLPQDDGQLLRDVLEAGEVGTIFANDPPPLCGNGLHMIDISDPKNPEFAGCESETGYVHDTQCVIYDGPDADHQGREICFNSNGIGFGNGAPNFFSIVDVTDKSDPVVISRVDYAGSAYSHQGWLTADQEFFLFGDEGDELTFGVGTSTRVWDVSDLENPFVTSTFENSTAAIDHNIYTQGDLAYASNYEAGLRVYDASDPVSGLSEVAFFDMYPETDNATFDGGSWSNYPYFRQKGIVAASSVDRGLFILRPKVSRAGN